MTAHDITDKKVVILTGGWSDEREIAFDSARACEKALREAGFNKLILIDVAAPDLLSQLTEGGFDVAFIAMHGAYGEDGCIQGLCEIMHLPYTFSDVGASAAACDKHLAKLIFENEGIPTPRGLTLDGPQDLDGALEQRIVDELGTSLFVKPASNGSSYGVTKVTERSQIRDAVELAGAEGQAVLVEECVEGMEITVPVIGNDDARALPIIEIVTGSEFYDLKVKYEPSELHHVIPARLDEQVYAHAQELAVRAHRALGCRGTSRSDFIVKADGTPVILETNTIPGMTETSLLPDSARHAGIEFPELCRMFVEYALEDAND
jgi:D-alanine-D-alanine ligase